MFSYRSILKQAWAIVWKHKYLWIFGLFASLAAAGGTMEYQFLTDSLSQGIIDSSYLNLVNILTLGNFFKLFSLGIANLFSQNIIFILNAITLLLLFLLLISLLVWLAITCQAALVDNVKKISTSKKKNITFSFRDGLTQGAKHFWPVLGLNILTKALVFLAFFIVSLPLLFLVGSNSYVFVIIYTILFTIFIPVAVSCSLVVKYAISYCILENYSLVKSIKSAWELFKKNWLISLEVALILFLISFLAGFIALAILFILFFPLFWVGLSFSITWLSIIILILGLIFVIAFGSMMTSFQITAWTNLYLQLKKNKLLAKLERIFKQN
ncbi:hypothetical protein GX917_00260 [Candidatus Falkowbacteria bacterium]|jgi:hypothetical protein|nr:hypothetical protein [Candidatus Falkowbacteria bacterium]